MQKVKITDITLRENSIKKDATLGFKEKVEIAKKLDRLNIDVIETAKIENKKTDTLFLHTISPLITNSILSCPVDYTEESVEETYNAIKEAKNKRLHLMVPVSSVQMEYMCHKKPAMIIEMVEKLVSKCKSLCSDVEFSALDATRSEKDFLYKVIETAITAGANTVTICDTAGEMLPDEFKAFVNKGNALSLAIGVIIGAAFTAIVSAINTKIISPIIGLLLGDTDLSESLVTVLKTGVDAETGEVVVTNAIYWGAFIQAVIDFLLTAVILFTIFKIFNVVTDTVKKIQKDMKRNIMITIL